MPDRDPYWYGLPLPPGVKAARKWGARAILEVVRQVRIYTYKTHVSLLQDRQTYVDPEPDPAAEVTVNFLRWVEKTAMPWLRKEVDRIGLGLDQDLEVALDSERYHLRANPRKSYGYLYIVCWEDQANEPPTQGG